MISNKVMTLCLLIMFRLKKTLLFRFRNILSKRITTNLALTLTHDRQRSRLTSKWSRVLSGTSGSMFVNLLWTNTRRSSTIGFTRPKEKRSRSTSHLRNSTFQRNSIEGTKPFSSNSSFRSLILPNMISTSMRTSC